jgi:hypothetical protein
MKRKKIKMTKKKRKIMKRERNKTKLAMARHNITTRTTKKKNIKSRKFVSILTLIPTIRILETQQRTQHHNQIKEKPAFGISQAPETPKMTSHQKPVQS